ncbi:hypothetical protein E2C01_013177 [Portunus trituberculatus]|uniref:Uncharacterized protein n=1 Tax=Portunus trituberculatus TaxID=210409 RepID=A0A5B7DFK4_PORTR|nr:hypothetical protein [Portunus trituberculatus]
MSSANVLTPSIHSTLHLFIPHALYSDHTLPSLHHSPLHYSTTPLMPHPSTTLLMPHSSTTPLIPHPSTTPPHHSCLTPPLHHTTQASPLYHSTIPLMPHPSTTPPLHSCLTLECGLVHSGHSGAVVFAGEASNVHLQRDGANRRPEVVQANLTDAQPVSQVYLINDNQRHLPHIVTRLPRPRDAVPLLWCGDYDVGSLEKEGGGGK